jgi:hypothetical protein
MNRMQSVDEDNCAGDWQTGVKGSLAEAVEQHGFTLAREARLGQP